MIRQQIEGAAQLAQSLNQVEKNMRQGTISAINASTRDAVAFSKKITPVKTGYLQSRTHADDGVSSGDVIMGSFSNDCAYGPYVCFGTRYMKARDFMTPASIYAGQRLLQRLLQLRVL